MAVITSLASSDELESYSRTTINTNFDNLDKKLPFKVVGTVAGQADYVCDGTADNVQIQAALDAVNAAGGGKVFLKEGTYNIAADMTIYDNTTLEGEGWATILKAATGVISMLVTPNDSGDNLIIRNLKWDANNIATKICQLGRGTIPPYSERILVEGCYFYNPTIAQKGAVNLSGSKLTFTNNFVENCWIVNFNEGNYRIFTNNYIKDTYDSCVSSGSGADYNWHHLIIANNVLEKGTGVNSGWCIDVFGGVTDSIIANNVCWGGNLDNITIQFSTSVFPGPRMTIANNICYNAGRNGINIAAGGGAVGIGEEMFIISGNHIFNPTKYGIQIGGDKMIVRDNYVQGGTAGYSAIFVYADASTSFEKISIIGNHCEDSIYVRNLRETNISNNYVENAYYVGILGRGIRNSIISNNIIKNSGQGADATYDDGILLVNGNNTVIGCINNVITGNRCFDDQTPKTQDYGIKTTENADYNTISNNIVLGNLTGGISTVGSNNQIRNNIGYVTENSGTGTIVSGATSAVITHGLAITPTLDDISITLGELSSTDPGQIYVTAIGATTFTVNCRTNPGVSNLDFAWKVIVL